MKIVKKSLRILGRSLLILLAFLLLVWLLIQTETVQNYILGKVTKRLSKDLNTEVSVQHVSLSLFNRANLEGTLIRDEKKDTLLYAGKLKIRITDWFFFKRTADFKYVGLEDANIKLQRTTKTWNYQFIADHFSGKDTSQLSAKVTGSKPATAADSSKGTVFDIKKVDLKNVSFLYNDKWIGQRMLVKIGSMVMDAEKMDMEKSIFSFNEVELDKPYFALYDFEGLRPDSLRPKKQIDTGMYFNEGDISVSAKKLKLTNGYIAIEQPGRPVTPGYFEPANIWISNINANFNNLTFIKDTIKAKIELSAKERSGLAIKKLTAQFRLTPQIMEFARMDLRTNKSHLTDYYAMRFDDFNEDMNEYVDSVTMTARFRNSLVHSDDIAFFAPEMKDWKKEVLMSGRFDGTVSHFDVKNLFLKSGNATYVSGHLSMHGLPDIDKTQINFTDGNIQTNYNESAILYKGLQDIKTPDLAALGDIRFVGSYKGTIHDFTTNGTITSSLGGAYTNISIKLPGKGDPSYSGTVNTRQFNLGRFIDNDLFGRVTFDGKINGRSFNLSRLNTVLDGTFKQFEFNGYNYSDLIINGNIQKKLFNGEFKSNDPNFNFTSSIAIDLNGEQPSFNVLGDLVNSNFQKLNFTPHDHFELTGLFDLNFKGKNIDAFLGTAKILNANLMHDSSKLSFDSLTLNAFVDSANRKILHVQSNEFDLLVRGQYNILDLSTSFQGFLHKYYPSLINDPVTVPKNQKFIVVFKTRQFAKYASILDAKLTGLDNAVIAGGVNTEDSGFYVGMDIPFVQYDKYKIENARVNGRGDYKNLTLTGDIGSIHISDSTYFPGTDLTVASAEDHSVVHLTTKANSTLNNASLNADVYTLNDGVRVKFRPSSFIINDKKWNLEKEGEIVVRKSFASASNVKFSQGFQEIAVETQEEDGGNTSNLVVKIKNLVLGDFTPLLMKQPTLEGLANGEVYLRDFFGKFEADANIKADEFRLNNDSIGTVFVKGHLNNASGLINFNVSSDNAGYKLKGEGSYDLKDSTGNALNTTLDLEDARVVILNQFLEGIFSDVKGRASGKLIVKGDPQAPDLIGKVALREGSLTVDYTKVHYTIDSAVFNFSEGLIDFGQFTIKDDAKRTATVKGKLYEHGFKDMRYDFDITSNKLLVLNTKKADNSTFYGRAIGKIAFSLKGPQDNMQMGITGEVNDTTHIYILTTTSKESAEADFIVFKQYGTEQKLIAKENTRLNIDLDLTANNKAQIDVILDELTGDVIQATGNGRMLIHVPSKGDMTMKGRYNIERGLYNFNFQSFIRKPFELLAGSGNYIEWTGDPYDARLNVEAKYTANNVSLKELISNSAILSSATTDLQSYRGDVYVIAQLTGKLSRPDIDFSIDFPDYSTIKNNQELAMYIRRLESDQNEMLKQASMLIVFGSFYPTGTGPNNSNFGGLSASLGINTISQKIADQANKILSDVLFKITGDKSLQFDISTSTYSSSSILTQNEATTGTTRMDRQNINLKVNQRILNDRIILSFGTGLDFGVGNNTTQTGSFQWLPDISVQWLITQDRKLRFIVFNKSSLDIATGGSAIGRKTRQGIGLSYSRDFEKVFSKKPKEPKDTPKVASDEKVMK
ncbi:translocation/assembly module TamB domain-containing protein [Danxiaibacter flavus]|uniref:Translocation/assembly module TamB domain-containing protein n=1 Tax=Danxiaibacter flavus TaxID=3049108 RepID=A0ABV3ZDL0_9BACT|nr:translocation/assembly module TamB domain-containing protein [Chitinophagaceae bacterium DXS]